MTKDSDSFGQTPPSETATCSADRAMLLAIMQDLDISSWQCPRCGHAEDCKTMDVAYMLRDYLAKNAAVSRQTETTR